MDAQIYLAIGLVGAIFVVMHATRRQIARIRGVTAKLDGEARVALAAWFGGVALIFAVGLLMVPLNWALVAFVLGIFGTLQYVRVQAPSDQPRVG